MTLKTRLYMSMLYLIHKKKLLTLDNILETGGMARNLAATIVNNLEVPAIVNQFTTEIEGVDIKLENLGLNIQTKIPIKFVQTKSESEPDLINGYVDVDPKLYENIVLELIADLPNIDICSQWECIKQEGRYDSGITHDIMRKMSQQHPMIVLNSIEYYYKPDKSLYEPWLVKIFSTSEEWDLYFSKLMNSISALVRGKYRNVRDVCFSKFAEIRETDMNYWMHSEFIPEVLKLYIRVDVPSNKWIIEVCDGKGKMCAKMEIQKDLSDLERGLEKIRSL